MERSERTCWAKRSMRRSSTGSHDQLDRLARPSHRVFSSVPDRVRPPIEPLVYLTHLAKLRLSALLEATKVKRKNKQLPCGNMEYSGVCSDRYLHVFATIKYRLLPTPVALQYIIDSQ